MKSILIMSLIGLAACTDAEKGSWSSLGESAEISCFSGGRRIFNDQSTGKVEMLDGGGGWHYRSTRGPYVRTFADCFVEVK